MQMQKAIYSFDQLFNADCRSVLMDIPTRIVQLRAIEEDEEYTAEVIRENEIEADVDER